MKFITNRSNIPYYFEQVVVYYESTHLLSCTYLLISNRREKANVLRRKIKRIHLFTVRRLRNVSASIKGSGLYTTSNPELADRILKYYNMDYDLISKMSLKELKNYLRIRGLKVNGRKNELVARVFAATEIALQPIRAAVEVEADLKTEYLAKMKTEDRNIPDPFKIPQNSSIMNEHDGMKFWPMLLYPDIFNCLMFFSFRAW